jgi:hypothetical protein
MTDVSAWREWPQGMAAEMWPPGVTVYVDLIDDELDRWAFTHEPGPESAGWRVVKPDTSLDRRPAPGSSIEVSFYAVASELLGPHIAERVREDLDREAL